MIAAGLLGTFFLLGFVLLVDAMQWARRGQMGMKRIAIATVVLGLTSPVLAEALLLALAGPARAGPDILIETDVPMSVAAKSYPDWNGIPDLSFTCEGVGDPSIHADLVVSHQARSIRINGAEAGPHDEVRSDVQQRPKSFR